MATGNAWADDLSSRPGETMGARAVERALGGRSKLLGIILAVVLTQIFFYLIYIDQSPLIPGSFSSFGPEMLFYLILMTPALFILGFAPSVHTNQTVINVTTGGSVFRFMATFSIVGFLAWTLMSLALAGLHASYATISGADRLQLLIIEAVFVASCETILFQLSLPIVMPYFVGASFLFAIFHVPVDALTIGLGNIGQIASAFIQRMVAGLILFAVLRYAGLGACVSAHFVYDAVLVGAMPGGFPISVTHLGLVPV